MPIAWSNSQAAKITLTARNEIQPFHAPETCWLLLILVLGDKGSDMWQNLHSELISIAQ
jgi:hypothetical protein